MANAGTVATAFSQVPTDMDSFKSPMRFPKGILVIIRCGGQFRSVRYS